MLSAPPSPVENLGKVCENSRAGENPRLCLGSSLICSRILPNVRLGFYQAMKAQKTCFYSWPKYKMKSVLVALKIVLLDDNLSHKQ